MIVRYQMGPFDDRHGSWSALELACVLMRRLEPGARIIVTCQGDIMNDRTVPGVEYLPQQSLEGNPYCEGRHVPNRYGVNEHEVWADNDHIMWDLPEGWRRFTARPDAALVWRCDWKYYGSYSPAAARGDSWDASAGMWGLPPGAVMPRPVYINKASPNMDEYGWVIKFLAEWPEHEYITQEEVPIYCPQHDSLKHRDVIGTHGVHLNGVNRGWNAKGQQLLTELRRKYL